MRERNKEKKEREREKKEEKEREREREREPMVNTGPIKLTTNEQFNNGWLTATNSYGMST